MAERTPKGAQQADRILEVAISLWADKGYAATTMRELAARAGIGIGTLYFHFRAKEDIVLYLYERINRDAQERFRASDDGGGSVADAAARFLRIKLELLAPHRAALPVILREAIDPQSKLSPFSGESSPTLERSVGFFASLTERDRSIAADRREATARLLWLGHIAVLLYWLHDRSPAQADTDELISALSGLGGWTRLMPMLGRLPGIARLRRLMTAPFERQAQAPAAADDEPALQADREADVVVIGGGPIGCLYACFLKRLRPGTRILVLERASEPGHKIGESTLSGFCKALRTVGIRQEALQRLFYPKNGLGFFHIDERTADLRGAAEYVLETFDETFQVERRVLDTLLIAAARRQGIDVLEGARVAPQRARIAADGCRVPFAIGSRELTVAARLVVDASGPGHALAAERGGWTSEGTTFQTSAAWSYWQGVKPLAEQSGLRARTEFPRDQYTQHLCFREGWLWYIPLHSFQEAPGRNLGRLIDRTLTAGRLPERAALELEYGTPTRSIASIGLSLRSDRDPRIADDARGALDHYRRRYPAIDAFLGGARLLDDHYGHGQPFQQRVNMRGHAREPAGDGYLLVGDAAFFVDPLISPGLTGGTATAYRAAETSARALEEKRVTAEALRPYGDFARRLHAALERDNQLVYMSFNHPAALALVQRFQETDARRHFLAHERAEYGADDTDVWGILAPSYEELQKQAWSVLREAEERVGRRLRIGEQSADDYGPAVTELETLLGDYLRANEALTPFVGNNAQDRKKVMA